jgi:hypothetical protein
MARLAIRSVCSAAPGIFGAAIRKDDILGSNHRRRTAALTYPSGINGLNTDVRFHWNGNAVELIGNAPGR